ncbi:MAG: RDD family protein [Candidatus Hodarchaeales archaeon]
MGTKVGLNQIDLYINEVSRLLPYPRSTKKEALDELRIDVQAAMRDSGGESPSTVFGNPLEVAKNVSQSHDWHGERAGWFVRFFAWMVDLFFETIIAFTYLGAGFLLLISFIPFDEMTQEFSKWESGAFEFTAREILLNLFSAFLIFTAMILFFGYNFFMEYYFSTTIGKKLFSLVVVDKTGVKMTGKQVFIRNLSKILISEELLPFDVVLGMILEKQDPKKTRKQRGLDILAETIVIKQKSL